MKFEVQLTLTVNAKNRDAALDLGVGAADHLRETFNDDESIHPAVDVKVLGRDAYVNVQYIVATGGSGCQRMRLSDIPNWLAEKPGALIYSLKD